MLAEPEHAPCTAILVVVVWKYFGFHMMLYIAGLQRHRPQPATRPRISTARRGWQMLRHVVTCRCSDPTIRLSVFFSVIGSLQLFDIIMPLTKGGPSDSTQTMVTFLYNYGVTRMRVGFGSAVGVVLFADLRDVRFQL